MSTNDLTLPGTLPGLLRRCSPVVVDGIKAVILSRDTRPADQRAGDWEVIADSQDSQDPFWVKYPMECYGISLSLKPEALALDLKDATGRAHAAWWLAGRLRPEVELMSVAVTYGHPTIGAGGYGLAVTCRNDGALWRRFDDVPGLDALDPNDPRTLEDGSRWVDAEALRLVCLHVGGVA